MVKRIFAILLSVQLFACAQAPVTAPQRSTAEYKSPVAAFCSRLLAREDSQFKFDVFCAARDKYAGQTITAEHFSGWRAMAVEELMALIELHTQQVNHLTKGLELEKLNARKRVLLMSEIEKLQRSEKNVNTRIRKLIAFWYETTHGENLKLSIKKNPLVISDFFKKVRAQNRLERLEGELSARSAIRVFAEAGVIDNPTWWEKEKRILQREHNVVQSVVALGLSAPAVATSGLPFIIFPSLNFDTASRLANEYEDLVAEKGHEEAKRIVLEGNMKRNVRNSYYRTIAHYANIAIFAAAISFTAYERHQDNQAHNQVALEKIYGTINSPADTRSAPVKAKSYAQEMAEETIRAMEAEGTRLTPQQKADILKSFEDSAAQVVAGSK